jgi:hypothetical protein
MSKKFAISATRSLVITSLFVSTLSFGFVANQTTIGWITDIGKAIDSAVPTSVKDVDFQKFKKLHPNATEAAFKTFLRVQKVINVAPVGVNKAKAEDVLRALTANSINSADTQRVLTRYLTLAGSDLPADKQKAEQMLGALRTMHLNKGGATKALGDIEARFADKVADAAPPAGSVVADTAPKTDHTKGAPVVAPKKPTEAPAGLEAKYPEVTRMSKQYDEKVAVGSTSNLYRGVSPAQKADTLAVLDQLQAFRKGLGNDTEALDNLATVISYKLSRGDKPEDIVKFFKEGAGKNIKTRDSLAGLAEVNWIQNPKNMDDYALKVAQAGPSHPQYGVVQAHYNIKAKGGKPSSVSLKQPDNRANVHNSMVEGRVKSFLEENKVFDRKVTDADVKSFCDCSDCKLKA